MWNIWRGERCLQGGLEGRDHWDDNIKMDLRAIGICGANWIRLAGGGFCEHGNEPSGCIKKADYSLRS
jgi:hypothetical protein